MRFPTPAIEPLGDPVAYLEGWTIWENFDAVWDSPGLPCALTMNVRVVDGRPRCVALTERARRDGAIDGTILRGIPVASLLDDAVAVAVMAEDEPGVSRFKTAADFRAYRMLKRPQRARQRWQLTPEHLAEVLRIFEQAEPHGAAEVARHFNKPRPTANRWVQMAKEEAAKAARKRARQPRRVQR